MLVHLLKGIPDPETGELFQALLDAALKLVPLEVEVTPVYTREELIKRVLEDKDDVMLLDWELAGGETAELVKQIVNCNRHLRIIALLPLQLRQYRQHLWAAGACASLPKEYLDQEWLSSVLCMVHRSMQREARLASTHSHQEQALWL